MKKRYLILVLVLGIMLSGSLVVGVTYSLWTLTNTQVSSNDLGVGCFSTTFTDQNNINLTNQFPISDTEGASLKAYTFTISNTCTIASNYQIDLETLSTTTAGSNFIKLSLNSGSPALLSSYASATTTISGALNGYKLTTGYLAGNQSVSYNLRLWIDENATTDDVANKVFESKIVVATVATDTLSLKDIILKSAGGTTTIAAKTTPTFSNAATTDEGMFAATDDYGTSYYYRGAVTNNNVLFGGFCWKAIRINGNGTTRMIYNGTPTNGTCVATGTATEISQSAFNTSYNDNAYAGYMYGTAGSTTYEATHANTNSSTAKTAIDTWYNTNLSSYASKISDTLFCNDRSIASTAATWFLTDTAKGYGTNATFYGAYNRIVNGNSPILTCANQGDRFTVSDSSKGNAKLTYPVGLITIDEVEMAGIKWNGSSNKSFYLYTNSVYWTMSSYNFNGNSAVELSMSSDGNINYGGVSHTNGLRPVINLNTDVNIASGDGTSTSPYVIS